MPTDKYTGGYACNCSEYKDLTEVTVELERHLRAVMDEYTALFMAEQDPNNTGQGYPPAMTAAWACLDGSAKG